MQRQSKGRLVVKAGCVITAPLDTLKEVKGLIRMNGKFFRKRGTSIEDLTLQIWRAGDLHTTQRIMDELDSYQAGMITETMDAEILTS